LIILFLIIIMDIFAKIEKYRYKNKNKMAANNEWKTVKSKKGVKNVRKTVSAGSGNSRRSRRNRRRRKSSSGTARRRCRRHEGAEHKPCDNCDKVICLLCEPSFGDVQCQHQDHVRPDKGGICDSCWYDDYDENCVYAWYAKMNYEILCKKHQDDPNKTTWEEDMPEQLLTSNF
jgi:hypothetical protein